MIGDYMPSTIYATILPTTYQNPTNTGKHTAYPTGVTQAAHKSIKDNWERNQFEFTTRENFQHAIKKQIIAAVLPEFIEEKKNRKKWFTGVSGYELMEYIMVRYVNITKPIKEQEKFELREDYDHSLPISKHFKRIDDTLQLPDDEEYPW